MLRPFYFPYTCLSDKERKAIEPFIDRMVVYRAFEPEHSDPGLDVVVPVLGDEDRVKAFLAEYNHFATFNMEKASAFMRSSQSKPLFDPTWASELRSEIVRFMDGPEDTSNDETYSLLWARAFIEIAHAYDENNRALDLELETVAQREKQLFESLMGGDSEDMPGLNPPSGAVESGGPDIRIKHRLAAWATLFVSAWPDKGKTGDGFYLTTQKAVIEELGEFVQGFHHVGDVSMEDVSKETFVEKIHQLVTAPLKPSPLSSPQGGRGSLSLYAVADRSPFECFADLLKTKPDVSSVSRPGIKNTVIGLVWI